jgi:hypothetical protein
MPSLYRSMVAACLTLSTVGAPLAAQQRSSGLDGAWRHVRTFVVTPDSSFARPTLQGLLVIQGRHFSQTWVIEGNSGVQQASQPNTAEQKAARYDVLIANAGTMEVRDTLVTLRYEQAKNPNVVGRTRVGRFRVTGDTLRAVYDDPWDKDRAKTVRTTITYVRVR